MDGIRGALTTKYGPLPGWAWAGTVAVAAVVFVFVRGKTSPAAPKPASSGLPGSTPAPGSATFITGGTYASGQQTPGPSQPATQQIKLQSIWGSSGAVCWVFATPADSAIVGTPPAGSVWDSAGPSIQGGSHNANGVTSSTWVPIKFGGSVAYVWGPEAVPVSSSPSSSSGGGMGGARPRGSIGSRSSRTMWHGHPLVKAQPRFLTHVGVGGGGHAATVHGAAAKAGVHPARLLVVNPDPERRSVRIV